MVEQNKHKEKHFGDVELGKISVCTEYQKQIKYKLTT